MVAVVVVVIVVVVVVVVVSSCLSNNTEKERQLLTPLTGKPKRKSEPTAMRLQQPAAA